MFCKLVLLFLVLGIAFGGVAKEKTKLQLKLVKIDNCDTIDNEIDVNVQINKVDAETNSYTGNGTLPYDLGDETQLCLNVAKWENNKWTEDFFNLKKDGICSFLGKVLGEVFFKLQDRWKMPRNQCPMPKGFYEDKDLILDLEHLELPKSAAGTLRATSKLMKNDKVIFCKVSTVEIW